MADLTIENHGSIFLLYPVTALGRDWVAENVAEDAMRFGDAVAVEHRYIEAIAIGAINDGLAVA